MPAGIVKTPQTGRAKDATPQGAKSAERTGSGGKKFVQTRLPFKLIAPVAKSAGPAGAAAASPGGTAAGGASAVAVIDLDSDEVELTPEQQQPRKRKLSYSGADKDSSDTSKENLETGGKKPKTTSQASSEDVIELVDDDEDEAADADDSETTVAEAKKAAKQRGRKPGTGSAPVQIKLPLSNKRAKRRKELKKSSSEQQSEEQQTEKAAQAVERSDSSDDIEAIAEELNPLKRAKVSAAGRGRRAKGNEATKAEEQQEEEEVVDVENSKLEEVSKLQEKPKTGKKPQTEKAELEKKTELSKGKPKAEEKGKPGKKPQTEKAQLEEKDKPEEKPKLGRKSQTEKKAKLEEKAELEEKPKTDEKQNKEDLPKVQEKPKVHEQSKKEEQSKQKEQSKQEELSKANQSDADLAMDVDSDEMLVESSDGEHKSDDVASTDIDDMDVDVDTETLNNTTPEKDKEKQCQDDDELSEVEANKSAVAAVLGADKAAKTLTPKQQRLMEQRRKAREEKERKLQEERRLKQQEKEEREQQKKQEREQKEEQRRKEREDKEQQRRQEREEKERKRLAENEEKERKRQAENEEKRKRTEAKEEVQRKKDEERRRKEQEKEEAEQKKKRAAATFSKFFVPKQPRQSVGGSMDQDQNSCDSGPSSSQTLAFRPFQIKDDMIMAPVIRASIPGETRRQLDKLFHVREAEDGDEDDDDLDESIGRAKRPTRAQLYLGELSLGKHKPQRGKRDVRLKRRSKDEEEDDDVLVVDELNKAGTPIVEERPKQLPWMRAKYLQFADNRRPAYYGTWRKRSQVISARHPLGQDKTHFDYEVDSDCEWEEEEPGESLSASEDEKERESEEESEEEYNEWFVPHGHLSDEELQNDGELEDGNTREAQKAKLQVLQQEFAQEMKKQTKKIKPRLLGPVWLDENGQKSQLCPAVFTQTIEMYGCWQLQPLTLEPPPEAVGEEDAAEESKSAKPSTMQLDEPLLQQLVRLIHGNSNSKVFLISEYLEYLKLQLPQDSTLLLPSKTLLREKFDEMAIWKSVELEVNSKRKKPKKRLCWQVNSETLHKYQLDDLTVKNQWSYTLTPKTNKADISLREASPPEPATEATPTTTEVKLDKTATATTSSTPKRALPAATATTTASPSSSGTPSGTKKRATLLMSVPRDQQFHAPTKNALISQYLRKQNDAEAEKKPPAPASLPSDDVVLLSD